MRLDIVIVAPGLRRANGRPIYKWEVTDHDDKVYHSQATLAETYE